MNLRHYKKISVDTSGSDPPVLWLSDEGYTAFYYAVTKNHFEVAAQLLNGLDLKELNKEDWGLFKEHQSKFSLLMYKTSSHVAALDDLGFFASGRSASIDDEIASIGCVIL